MYSSQQKNNRSYKENVKRTVRVLNKLHGDFLYLSKYKKFPMVLFFFYP